MQRVGRETKAWLAPPGEAQRVCQVGAWGAAAEEEQEGRRSCSKKLKWEGMRSRDRVGMRMAVEEHQGVCSEGGSEPQAQSSSQVFVE